MSPWWIVFLYYIGGLTMARILVLWAKEDVERRAEGCPKCGTSDKWCSVCARRNVDLKIARVFGIIWWPLPAVYMISKKIIFPHGIVTRYQKQKNAERKRAEKAAELRRQEAKLREVCENLNLPWSVVSLGREEWSERERSNG